MARERARRGELHPDPLVDAELAPGARAAAEPRRRRAERTIVLVIGVAGIFGALCRYALGHLLATPPGRFPWGTFWANVAGSFVIGLVLVLLAERFPRARVARPLIVTGFLGAFTTFSTYMVDADLLFRSRHLGTGALYTLASLAAGGAAVFAGVLLARLLVALDHRLEEDLGR